MAAKAKETFTKGREVESRNDSGREGVFLVKVTPEGRYNDAQQALTCALDNGVDNGEITAFTIWEAV